MILEYVIGGAVGGILAFIAVDGYLNSHDPQYPKMPGRPESTDEYMARRRAADDAKFKHFLEQKRKKENQ